MITSTNSNISSIENIITEIEKPLKNALILSLDEISKNPTMEKELLSLWFKRSENIVDFFIKEAEERGKSKIIKNIIKYIMFKR